MTVGALGLHAGAILCLAVWSAAALSPAAAAEAVAREVTIEVSTSAAVLIETQRADGATSRVWAEPTDLQQGEQVHYTVRIHNPGARAAHNVIVTKPIPANTSYVEGSAAAPGATTTFSADGGRTFAAARDLLESGGGRVPPDRYTHVRWQLRYPLAPGATALARFRAVFR